MNFDIFGHYGSVNQNYSEKAGNGSTCLTWWCVPVIPATGEHK
jgi:hypothetical protein